MPTSATALSSSTPVVSSTSSSTSSSSSSSLNGGRKRSRRHQPSAASTFSSQLDYPFMLAFVAVLVIYMFITLLTYEKLSRESHAVVTGGGGEDDNDKDASSSRMSRLVLQQQFNLQQQQQQQQQQNTQTKNVDYLQHHSFPLHVQSSSSSVDDDDMEWIRHPGLEWVNDPMKQIPKQLSRSIQVPRFWSEAYSSYYNQTESIRQFLGNNGQQIMTPYEASLIGSYSPMMSKTTKTTTTTTTSSMLETIYCSVASYRDYECTPTVQDIYERAKYPERIRVAVIDQSVSGTDIPCLTPETSCTSNPEQVLCKYRHLIDYYHLDAQLAVGPVFARHLAHRMYRGEYYAMQVDSHVRFIQDWDVDIVSQWKSAKNEYAVLTTYLSDVHGRIDPVTHVSLNPARPIMCMSDFEGSGDMKHLRHGQQPEGPPGIHGQPTLEPFWAAGFSFARGHFVVQVPYDQYLPMVFQGEEISIGLRAFTYGYDFYAPEKGVCFHIYAAQDKTEKRKKIPMFWENTRIYIGAGQAAMKRLNSIIGMNRVTYPAAEWPQQDVQKYGLGKIRTTDTFFQTFGIHIQEQRIEQHLCRFVGKPMMNQFLPALRSNGMGLDYGRIHFKYVDQVPNKSKTQQKGGAAAVRNLAKMSVNKLAVPKKVSFKQK